MARRNILLTCEPLQDATLDSGTDPRTSIAQAMELLSAEDESEERITDMEAFIE